MLAASSAGSFCPKQLAQAQTKSQPSQCCPVHTTCCLLVINVILLAQWAVGMVLPVTYFASQIHVIY